MVLQPVVKHFAVLDTSGAYKYRLSLLISLADCLDYAVPLCFGIVIDQHIPVYPLAGSVRVNVYEFKVVKLVKFVPCGLGSACHSRKMGVLTYKILHGNATHNNTAGSDLYIVLYLHRRLERAGIVAVFRYSAVEFVYKQYSSVTADIVLVLLKHKPGV